jgi:hypothetical protein
MPEDFDPSAYYIGAELSFEANSNALTNRFISSFYNGKYIDHDMKTAMLEGLRAQGNQFYFGMNEKLGFRIPDSSGGIFYYGGLEDRNFAELVFTRDFFELYFFGNSGHTGENVAFGPVSLQFLRYQQFSTGVGKVIQGKKGLHIMGASLGINKGQNHLMAEVSQGSFYTAEDAEFVELQLDMTLKRSDTAFTDLKAVNGYGLSLGFFYRFEGERDKILISSDGIGFIRWNKQSQQFSRDTNYRFDGFYIDDLFDISGATFDASATDSLLSEFTYGTQKGNYISLLPSVMKLSYTHTFDEGRIHLETGIVHRHFCEASTQFYVKPVCRFAFGNSRLDIAPVARYGGYSNLNTGLEAGFYYKKKLAILAGCPSIDALLMPSQLAGAAAYLSIYKSF